MAMKKASRTKAASAAAKNTARVARDPLALDTPVEGVVRGSALEYHINYARCNIAAWPADVRAALRIND